LKPVVASRRPAGARGPRSQRVAEHEAVGVFYAGRSGDALRFGTNRAPAKPTLGFSPHLFRWGALLRAAFSGQAGDKKEKSQDTTPGSFTTTL